MSSAVASSTSFTPRPIVVLGRNKFTEIVGFTVIGTSEDHAATAYVAYHSDALLYAAAPKMYEALRKLKTWLGTLGNNDMSPNDAIEYVDDVLAEAEGKS